VTTPPRAGDPSLITSINRGSMALSSIVPAIIITQRAAITRLTMVITTHCMMPMAMMIMRTTMAITIIITLAHQAFPMTWARSSAPAT
jgi:hypothetical protein